MKSYLLNAVLLGVLAGTAHATIMFTQTTPDPSLNAFDITTYRVADDFTLSGSTALTNVVFYYAYDANGLPTNLSNITYAIYANNAGTLGSVLGTQTVAITAANITGQTSICPQCASASFAINSLSLAAGTYWLELHADTTLTGNNSGTPVYWEVAVPNSTYSARWDNGTLGTPNTALSSGYDQYMFQLSDSTPEPGTIGLVVVGLAGCLLKGRRRTRQG